MSRSNPPVRFTGQHFTMNRQLIADAIRWAAIQGGDTVLDIGAGKGHLTIPLSSVCHKVIAIEKDRALGRVLQKRFADAEKVEVVCGDVRNFESTTPFKTVSNIPFGITSDILKFLMFQQADRFGGGTLMMQLETAEKLFSEERFNPYTILYHTFYDLKLIRDVSPDCFMPPPTVMSALVQIRKKKRPYVQTKFREKYLSFLFYFLRKPHMKTRTALKRLFRKRQVRELSKKHGIDLEANITSLSPKQWSGCFEDLLDLVPERYHP